MSDMTPFEKSLDRDMELVFQAPLGAGISVTLVTEDGSTHELRAMFEPRCAALACRRATAGELEDILKKGAAVEACIRAGRDRTQADQAFHTAIVRAAHNEFLLRLLPLIQQAVSTAVEKGERREQLSEDTLRDHALLLEFLQKRDREGAEHAMAIHMRHSMDVMGLEEP